MRQHPLQGPVARRMVCVSMAVDADQRLRCFEQLGPDLLRVNECKWTYKEESFSLLIFLFAGVMKSMDESR